MNNILEKAIEKAIAGGWEPPFAWPLPNFWVIDNGIYSIHDGYDRREMSLEELIFDHDFAKALWGDDPRRYYDQYEPADEAGQIMLDNWEYHLQEMVIADDPIQYLEENL